MAETPMSIEDEEPSILRPAGMMTRPEFLEKVETARQNMAEENEEISGVTDTELQDETFWIAQLMTAIHHA